MRHERGFTLVELMLACTVVGVVASLAMPSFRQPLLRAHRSDAVLALTRLQAAQERWRVDMGSYTDDLSALRVSRLSDDGLYTLSLEPLGPEAYRASARAAGAQAADTECPVLTLEVRSGFTQTGPSLRCWNR